MKGSLAIIFDLDGTLLDFAMAEKIALHDAFASVGIELTNENAARYSSANSEAWGKYESGDISLKHLNCARFDIFDNPEPSMLAELSDNYLDAMSRQGQTFQNTHRDLELLQDRFALYVASNGFSRVQKTRLEVAGLSQYFHRIFVSEDLGYAKPRKDFFELVKCAIISDGHVPYAMIGDSLRADVEGARAVRLRGVHINRTGVECVGCSDCVSCLGQLVEILS
jgi:HAD superfamily hydrolase (TIGR01549 family)